MEEERQNQQDASSCRGLQLLMLLGSLEPNTFLQFHAVKSWYLSDVEQQKCQEAFCTEILGNSRNSEHPSIFAAGYL